MKTNERGKKEQKYELSLFSSWVQFWNKFIVKSSLAIRFINRRAFDPILLGEKSIYQPRNGKTTPAYSTSGRAGDLKFSTLKWTNTMQSTIISYIAGVFGRLLYEMFE